MNKLKFKIKTSWFWVGLLSVLLAAPNATIIKASTSEIDPLLYNAIRFLMLALVALPYVLTYRKKINKINIKYTAYVGVFLSFATVGFVLAIKHSQASYVSILTLLTPIMLVIFARKLAKENISSKVMMGVATAALGAFIVVFVPIVISHNAPAKFYPLATIFILINVATFPLSIIYSKKANQAGLSLLSIIGLSAWIIALANFVLFLCGGSELPLELNINTIGYLLYSGLIVAFLARILNIASYEKIGAGVIASLMYLEAFVAIMLPIIFLNEKLSYYAVVGGIIILVGVFLTEQHKLKLKHHFGLFKHY